MGFEIDVARNFAAQFVPGGQVLMVAGNLVPDSIRNFPFSLLGGLPRGDLQKFRRTIFPALVAKAQASNGIAAAVWFGEIILVRADGSVDTIARNMHDLSAALSALRTLANRMREVIYVFRCAPGVDFEVPSQVSSRCRFDAFLPRLDPADTAVDLVPDPAEDQPITQEISLQVVSPVPIQAGFAGLGVPGLLVVLGFGILLFALRE